MVTISDIPPRTIAGSTSFSVGEFRRQASLGGELRVVRNGGAFKLVAIGMTTSGRSVEWVEPVGDVVGMFVATLEKAFGENLSQIVVKEFELYPDQGKPLLSRTVVQALLMVETVGIAMDGVQFIDQNAQTHR